MGLSASRGAELFTDDACKQANAFWSDGEKMVDLWQRLDPEENGYIDISALREMVPTIPGFEKYDLSSPALMRAYKATCYGTGNTGDAWIQRSEFRILLRNVFYFGKICTLFPRLEVGELDVRARRVGRDELDAALAKLGLDSMPDAERARLMVDTGGRDEQGRVLFNDLAKLAANRVCPGSNVAELDPTEFSRPQRRPPRTLGRKRPRNPEGLPASKAAAPALDSGSDEAAALQRAAELEALEETFVRGLLADENRVRDLWREIDPESDERVPLEDVQQLLLGRWPELARKDALARAYQTSCSSPDDVSDAEGWEDDDAWLVSADFAPLMAHVYYFNRLWAVFDDIDVGRDREIGFGEFVRALARLKMDRPVSEAEATFDRLDRNSGGRIKFDAFAAWVADDMMEQLGIKKSFR
jgi:Ca2+-binding EF-hand superfamily protein